MKKIKILFLIAFVLVVFGNQSFAHGDCLTGKEFSAYKKANKKLVVLDVRSPKDYAKMHIMRSVNVFHKDLYKDPSIKGMIKSPAELAAYLGKKGISNTSKIVIYDDGSSKYSTRVYWILKYLGATDVKILHKDMTQWKLARIPLTRSVTPAKKVTFTPTLNKAIIADISDVKALAKNPNAILIDARTADEFAGKTEKSKGHLPGALHMDYVEVLKSKKGFFKSKADLDAITQKYGLAKDKEIIIYCNTGIFAAVTYFTLVNHLGYENVRVYEGSYLEWVGLNNPLN